MLARAAQIRLVIFDVDGVLTDGRIGMDAEGREYKSFHARDGLGIKRLQSHGVAAAVISGRKCPAVQKRMESLGIAHIYQGYENKVTAFEDLSGVAGLPPESIAHVGDDVLDIPLFTRVGLAIAVKDAHPAILRYAHWRTSLPGGYAAAREVCDLILFAQGISMVSLQNNPDKSCA